jgi:hypothetical protein
MFGPARERLEAACNAGREEAPYKASLTSYSLAEDPEAAARASIGLASIVL